MTRYDKKLSIYTSVYRHEMGRYFYLELLGLGMKFYIFAERGHPDVSMSVWDVFIRWIVLEL